MNTSGFTHSVLGLTTNFTTIVLINAPSLSETSKNSGYNFKCSLMVSETISYSRLKIHISQPRNFSLQKNKRSNVKYPSQGKPYFMDLRTMREKEVFSRPTLALLVMNRCHWNCVISNPQRISSSVSL